MTHSMSHICDNPVSWKPKTWKGFRNQGFTHKVLVGGGVEWGEHSWIAKELFFKKTNLLFSKVKMGQGSTGKWGLFCRSKEVRYGGRLSLKCGRMGGGSIPLTSYAKNEAERVFIKLHQQNWRLKMSTVWWAHYY